MWDEDWIESYGDEDGIPFEDLHPEEAPKEQLLSIPEEWFGLPYQTVEAPEPQGNQEEWQ